MQSRICFRISLAVILASLFAFPALAAGEGYVLVSGKSDTGVITLFDMTGSGQLSVRSSFDVWPLTEKFGDPVELVVSRTGRYLYMYDFNDENGVVFSVDPDCGFHIIRELIGDDAGGFSLDEDYLFTSSLVDQQNPTGPKVNVYKLNGGGCQNVFSQVVSTTAALMFTQSTNSFDEVIASGLNGLVNSPPSLVVYQFNRTSETLSLKQYNPSVAFDYSAINGAGDLAVYTRATTIGCVVRNPDGVWESASTYWNSDWSHGSGGNGICLRPDGKYAVASIYADWYDERGDAGGLAVLSFTPEKELVLRSYLRRTMVRHPAMTPDGKFVVVDYWIRGEGRHFGVFRLWENGILEEVYTMPINYFMAGMAFLPQGSFSKAKSNWESYSSNDKAARRPKTPRAPPSLCDNSRTNRPPAASLRSRRR